MQNRGWNRPEGVSFAEFETISATAGRKPTPTDSQNSEAQTEASRLSEVKNLVAKVKRQASDLQPQSLSKPYG